MKRDAMERARAYLRAREGLTAALIAAGFLLACACVQRVTFLTNDDNAIAFALAGYQTGAPYPYALFINCLLGYAVSGLYTLLPNVPWWTTLQLLSLLLAYTGVGAALLRVSVRRSGRMWLGLALYGTFLLLCCIRPVIQMTYTVTAAALGACGAALSAAAAREEDARRRRIYALLGLLAVILAFLYREETGFAALCFYLAAQLYRALAGGWKCALALLIAAATLCGAAFAFNNAMRARVDGAAYTEFFHWRERFTDYPRDSYAENPALYASVGWDEPLYDLTNNWCFLDERIDAASLRTITTGSEERGSSLGEALQTLLRFFREEVAASRWPLLALALLAYFISARTNDKRNRAALLAALAALLGGAALCVYLCLGGRFLLRTFQVVALPCAALTLCLAADASLPSVPSLGRIRGVFAAICLLIGLMTGVPEAVDLRRNGPDLMLGDARAVNAYALAHPDSTYIRDVYAAPDIDAQTVYPAEKPVNLISWGGCGMRSEAYRRQLAANELDADAYAELFLREDVYFLTRAGSAQESVLRRYFDARYGDARFTLVDTIAEQYAVYSVSTVPGDA